MMHTDVSQKYLITEQKVKSEIANVAHDKLVSGDRIVYTALEYSPTVLPDGRTRQVVMESASGINYNHTTKQEARNRVTLLTRPGSVTVTESRLLTGMNGKKRWYRWETFALCTWYTTSRGNVATLMRERVKRTASARGGLNPAPWSGTRPVYGKKVDSLIDSAQKMIFCKVVTLADIYPILAWFCDDAPHFVLPRQYQWSSTLRNSRYSNDYKLAFTDITRGVYSKQLFKASKGVKPGTVNYVANMKGMSMDWRVAYMRVLAIEGSSPVNPTTVLDCLDKNQKKVYFRKFLESDPAYRVLTSDIGRFIVRLRENGVDFSRALKEPSLTKIHDALVQIDRALRTAREDKYADRIDCWNYPELNMDLGDGVRIYLAENTVDMVQWGLMFNHCIGSSIHTDRVSADNVYGMLEREGKPIGNFNLSSGRLVQAYGINNRPIAELDRKAYDMFVNHLRRIRLNEHISNGNVYITPDPMFNWWER